MHQRQQAAERAIHCLSMILNRTLAKKIMLLMPAAAAAAAHESCAQVLDSALTRPGRLSRRVIVPLPDEQGRAEIMAVHLRNTPMASAQAKVALYPARTSSIPTFVSFMLLVRMHDRGS